MAISEEAARAVKKRNIAKSIKNINECPVDATSINYKMPSSLENARQLSGNETLAYYMDS